MSQPLDLDAIRARVEGTTELSWRDVYEGHAMPTVEDATFIAAAREDVPALIAEVERAWAATFRYGQHLSWSSCCSWLRWRPRRPHNERRACQVVPVLRGHWLEVEHPLRSLRRLGTGPREPGASYRGDPPPMNARLWRWRFWLPLALLIFQAPTVVEGKPPLLAIGACLICASWSRASRPVRREGPTEFQRNVRRYGRG
jgi:hypothetical protein